MKSLSSTAAKCRSFILVRIDSSARLNPIRAKVSLGLRVLHVGDLGFGDKGGHLYLVYQQRKERLAAMAGLGDLGSVGLESLP